jgi:RNA polymerase sigma factor (sigma-70 family)
LTDSAIARTRQFEAAMLPHLDAAYNVARWLLRDDFSAQDAVQEAYLRAFKFFESYHGGAARPWLLGIVRNTCFTWLADRGQAGAPIQFDEERDSEHEDEAAHDSRGNPENQLIQKLDKARIDRAIDSLPPLYREVIVLRELEELSYEEIAQVVAIPIGTVMSRLARARGALRSSLDRNDFGGQAE